MSLQYLVPGARLEDGYELLSELPLPGVDKRWRVRGPDGQTRLWRVIDLAAFEMSIDPKLLELATRLRHPHLDEVRRHFVLRNRNALVLESELPEATLGERLRKQQGPLSPAEASRHLEQAAAALDFLNEPNHVWQGATVALFHRNLHPDALALHRTEQGLVCRVGDFGLSKPAHLVEMPNSRGLTRYQYDAPELYEGRVSTGSDQYSLAIIYAELRNGRPPFVGSMLAQLEQRLAGRVDLTGMSDAEELAVRRALSRDPGDRFSSCGDFAARISAAVATLRPTSVGARPLSKIRTPSACGPSTSGLACSSGAASDPPMLSGPPSAARVRPPPNAASQPLEFPKDRLPLSMLLTMIVAVAAAVAFAAWIGARS